MLNFLKLNLFLGCAVRCDFHGILISNKKFKKTGYRKELAVTRQRYSTASKSSRSLDLVQPSGWKVEAWRLTHVGSLDFVMASDSNLRSLQYEDSSKQVEQWAASLPQIYAPPSPPPRGSTVRILGLACQSTPLQTVTMKNITANENRCPTPLWNSNFLILIQIQQAGQYNSISIGHVVLTASC